MRPAPRVPGQRRVLPSRRQAGLYAGVLWQTLWQLAKGRDTHDPERLPPAGHHAGRRPQGEGRAPLARDARLRPHAKSASTPAPALRRAAHVPARRPNRVTRSVASPVEAPTKPKSATGPRQGTERYGTLVSCVSQPRVIAQRQCVMCVSDTLRSGAHPSSNLSRHGWLSRVRRGRRYQPVQLYAV